MESLAVSGTSERCLLLWGSRDWRNQCPTWRTSSVSLTHAAHTYNEQPVQAGAGPQLLNDTTANNFKWHKCSDSKCARWVSGPRLIDGKNWEERTLSCTVDCWRMIRSNENQTVQWIDSVTEIKIPFWVLASYT